LPANGSPGAQHDECPIISHPQLPPANYERNGNTNVSQVNWCQTVQAPEGHHCQLKGDSLLDRKPVKLTQHWGNAIELPGPGHNITTCCCILDSLQFRQETIADFVQQAVAVTRRLLMNARTIVFTASKVNNDLTSHSWHS